MDIRTQHMEELESLRSMVRIATEQYDVELEELEQRLNATESLLVQERIAMLQDLDDFNAQVSDQDQQIFDLKARVAEKDQQIFNLGETLRTVGNRTESMIRDILREETESVNNRLDTLETKAAYALKRVHSVEEMVGNKKSRTEHGEHLATIKGRCKKYLNDNVNPDDPSTMEVCNCAAFVAIPGQEGYECANCTHDSFEHEQYKQGFWSSWYQDLCTRWRR
ncbi:hypothetical protein BJ508DRAFT_365501 [Ascobolus immersus RN42]|uniref:Uncharacterized protein n=1 Tax=Ascobolus immersus RN42 TaxID=1160509 RepID=A0A3N4HPK2_ASCIM|nr:hypothetical protein BJ508DRAFT_365501 [Ascobolus immersus RN42]